MCVCVCARAFYLCLCLLVFVHAYVTFAPPTHSPSPALPRSCWGLINVHHDTLMKRRSCGANKAGWIQQDTLCVSLRVSKW